jgi:hypothetical protein
VALEYAYRRCRNRDPGAPEWSVLWVHADNETTFAQDYKAIARKLGLPNNLDGEDLLAAVRDQIEALPRCLLVLDNADNLALFGFGIDREATDISTGSASAELSLYDYIPRCATGAVLWTSCDERIIGTLTGAQKGVQVGRMTVEEATELLEHTRNKPISDDEAEEAAKLLKELQWLPLAISQAGAYLRRTSTPISGYLSRLVEGKERWKVLKITQPDQYRRPGVPNSILETWTISIERIQQENEMAYRIMHTIVYLYTQNIPFEIVTAAAAFGTATSDGEPSNEKDDVIDAVTRLREFSFLKLRKTKDTTQSYEMHKLVEEATRYGLSAGNFCTDGASRRRASSIPESERHFSRAALQIVAGLFPERRREAWPQCERYLAHAVRAAEWAELCSEEVEAANLLTRVSDYLYDRGRWREKEPVDTRAYGLRRAMLGDKYPATIRSIAELAATYYAQGRYDEAEKISVEMLALRRDVLGDKHPDTIGSIASLAATYYT